MKHYVKILAILILLLLLVYSGGFYYQTQSDTVFPTYIFGFYSLGTNALPNSFGCFSFISEIMNYLGKLMPPEYVYDGFQFLMVISSIVILAIKIFDKYRIGNALSFFLFFSILIFLSDFFRPFEFSKTSFVVAFAALYNPTKKSISLISLLLLILAFLIRPEPVVICVILFVAFEFLTQNKNYFTIFFKYSTIAFLLFCISVLVNSGSNYEENYYQTIRPYEYALSDFNKINQSYGNNKQDSVKLNMAVHFFYADKEKINVDLFNKLKVVNIDKTPLSIIMSFKNFKENIVNGIKFLNNPKKLFFIVMFYVFIIVIMVLYKFYDLSIFLFFALVLISFISIYFKLEYHFFTPIMAIALIVSLSFFCKKNIHFEKNILYYFLIIGIVLIGMGFINFQNKLINKASSKQTYYSHVFQEIENSNNRYNVLNVGVWDEFHNKLFTKIQPNNSDNIIVLDGGILYINRMHQKNLRKISNKDTFVEQYLYFLKNSNSILYSPVERFNLINDYTKLIYNVHFDILYSTCYGQTIVEPHKKVCKIKIK